MSVDSYMNIQLSGTEEFVDGKSTGSLGQVLIRYSPHPTPIYQNVCEWACLADRNIRDRCNNVLWISADKNAADSKQDIKMEG